MPLWLIHGLARCLYLSQQSASQSPIHFQTAVYRYWSLVNASTLFECKRFWMVGILNGPCCADTLASIAVRRVNSWMFAAADTCFILLRISDPICLCFQALSPGPIYLHTSQHALYKSITIFYKRKPITARLGTITTDSAMLHITLCSATHFYLSFSEMVR